MARPPRWTEEEISRIDAAKAAVEAKFGAHVGELHTRQVTDKEVMLQRGPTGEWFRRLKVGGAWRTQVLAGGVWRETRS